MLVRCGVWCLWCLCVARLGTRKTPSCVGSKRLHVYVQNALCVPAKRAHVEHKRAFRRYTRRRLEPTHGPLSLSLSLSLSSCPFFFLSSVVLSRRSLPSFSISVLKMLTSLLQIQVSRSPLAGVPWAAPLFSLGRMHMLRKFAPRLGKEEPPRRLP